MNDKIYIAIDLKSFYASVECRERGLDPLTTNLVVADKSRTDKTICLAVTPSLKERGISGRPRLFEVVQKVKVLNAERKAQTKYKRFRGKSFDDTALKKDIELELDYIVAPPRMGLYVDYSARIYEVYLKYFSEEDIIVYSIDEVFIDITPYMTMYAMSPHDLAMKVLQDVLKTTGITATCGIGTNLFLAKVAMDIKAKHIPADKDGVRIAQLDEQSFRRELWNHTPLTDFWRIGNGYARRLAPYGIYTMGDIARTSVGKNPDGYNEELLYNLFGINAELLIDHAWGWEPCTVEAIKAYKPMAKSLGSGQVLHRPYNPDDARLVVREMIDALALDLVANQVVCDQMVLTIGYDIENLSDPSRRENYQGEIRTDAYGRMMPRHSHGTSNLDEPTSSAMIIVDKMLELYDRIVDKQLLIRRLTMSVNHLQYEWDVQEQHTPLQLSIFDDYEQIQAKQKRDKAMQKREKKRQLAILEIKGKYGKNALLKGMNLKDAATQKDRNEQIGGHKA